MPNYMRQGQVPAKRHTRLDRDPAASFNHEGICYEHVVTTEGFDRAYSILYHLRPPTRVRAIEAAGTWPVPIAPEDVLRHHHLRTAAMPRAGDPIRGRVPLLTNPDVTCYRCRPATPQTMLFRNGTADEVIFVFHGGGVLESVYGKLPYREGDYIVIPRGITYRLAPKAIAQEDYLILEMAGAVRVPHRYMNRDGQIQLGAPFCERDLHGPQEPLLIDSEKDTEVLVKDGSRLTRYVLASHPFDAVGWDGFIYPYTFNVDDFEPITGTVHQPPPVQQTFEARGIAICTFAPRLLDTHPRAIKVPYVHSNVEADEVLFYVRGQFGSRKGVESGSISLHPRGLPHGPHPGTIMASMNQARTEELAVMFDTEKPLALTLDALKMDDPGYPMSWL
ncbi:MAG TPA: homogentisate 1,2-dioxygenase domain-containing protein [Planctomycetota bacterium]|nr:homogentisate 1,2-dioxygenase domain-containing protein [Planctomycetota bacterium]